MAEDFPQKKSVVILGTGFGGFSFLKKISEKFYDISVVSPRNHFLFTPLLPSTTVGTLEFRSIIEPVRTAQPRIDFYQAACESIDFSQKKISCRHVLDEKTFTLTYDILIITVGTDINTFGIPGVKEHCLFLKELGDARAIRQKIIECFERASTPGLEENEKKRLTHFVVVGGGPTGVEFAAEMHDFLEEDLSHWFPEQARDARITLFEATSEILSSFDKELSDYALKIFKRQKICVRTESAVKSVDANQIQLADGSLEPYGLIVWAAGNSPRPLVADLSVPKNREGRIITDSFFRVPKIQDVYALGDCAVTEEVHLPATAQAAQQAGSFLAQTLNRIAQNKPVKGFEYKHMGMLAYIGSHRALADLPNVKGRGLSAWFFWRSAYLTKLVSLKNKMMVLFDWMKKFFFGRDISRF